MKSKYVTFCLIEPTQPFICYVEGSFTIADLQEIEKEFIDNLDDFINEADGQQIVTYKCWWDPGQFGEYGRCEMPSYWDLTKEKIILGGL